MPAGRPKKFKTVAELDKAIDHYFKVKKDHPTITGLALELGFTSRLALIRIEGYGEEFSNSIKRAKLQVENFYEEQLTKNNSSGAIFALKNFDWRDRQDIDHTTGGEKITITLTDAKH
jgi:hypothetical protein